MDALGAAGDWGPWICSVLHAGDVVGLPYPRWPVRVGKGRRYRVNEIPKFLHDWCISTYVTNRDLCNIN